MVKRKRNLYFVSCIYIMLIFLLGLNTVNLFNTLAQNMGGGVQSTELWTAHVSTPPGLGTSSNPYLISTPEQLAWIAKTTNASTTDLSGKYFSLVKDIDLKAYTWVPIGTSPSPFKGALFDGGNHTIKNMVTSKVDAAGLFGCSQGEIKNVVLSGVDVQGITYAGGVCAISRSNIRSCSVKDGIIKATGPDSTAGGIVGINHNLCTSCVNAAMVSGENFAGGIVGYQSGVLLSVNRNTGTVVGKVLAGGIAGKAYNAAIIGNNFAECTIISMTGKAGGIVGDATVTVTGGNTYQIIACQANVEIVGASGVYSAILASGSLNAKVINSCGTADIISTSNTKPTFNEYGIPTGCTTESVYAYTRINGAEHYKRYSLSTSETIDNSFPSSFWAYDNSINGGLPFVKHIFNIGDSLNKSDSMAVLRANGFTRYIDNTYLPNDIDPATELQYYEFWMYPQSFYGGSVGREVDVMPISCKGNLIDLPVYEAPDNPYGYCVLIDDDFYSYQGDYPLYFQNGDPFELGPGQCFAIEPVKWTRFNNTEDEFLSLFFLQGGLHWSNDDTNVAYENSYYYQYITETMYAYMLDWLAMYAEDYFMQANDFGYLDKYAGIPFRPMTINEVLEMANGNEYQNALLVSQITDFAYATGMVNVSVSNGGNFPFLMTGASPALNGFENSRNGQYLCGTRLVTSFEKMINKGYWE